ncbi:MAG: hypothetical protein ACRERU_12080 [Methylococcales bacterium]
MIPFTARELQRAWRQARVAFDAADTKTNAHRLLLFYAVETGLKAVFLKRESKQDSEGKFTKFQHDLNKLMDHLKVGTHLRLKSEIRLDALKSPERPRKPNCEQLNQIWRYGAQARYPTDEELETQLLVILDWIEGELK